MEETTTRFFLFYVSYFSFLASLFRPSCNGTRIQLLTSEKDKMEAKNASAAVSAAVSLSSGQTFFPLVSAFLSGCFPGETLPQKALPVVFYIVIMIVVGFVVQRVLL